MSPLPSWLPHYNLLISNAQCSHLNSYWWTMMIWGVFTSCLSDKRAWVVLRPTILGAILCFILCHTWFLCFVVDWHYGYFPCDYDEKWDHGDSTHDVWWIYTWALVACRPKSKIFAFGKNHQTFRPCRFGGLQPLSGEWKFQVPTYTEGLGFSFTFSSILEAYDLSALPFKTRLNACCPF